MIRLMSECFIIFFFEWKPQTMTLENPSDSGYFRNCTTATLGFQIGSQIICTVKKKNNYFQIN